MQEYNTKMNGRTKIDEQAKKLVVLDGIIKLVVGCLLKFPKLIEVMVEIFKIAKSIEADEPKRKLGGASQQRA